MGGMTPEQAHELAALSRSLGRQVGLLLDRQGRPFMVLLGERDGIFIPELPRSREGMGRLRGLRLLHTHLDPAQNRQKPGAPVMEDQLSREDMMDLLFLRLDNIAVLTVDEWGEPRLFQQAHLLPPNPENEPYLLHAVQSWDRVNTDFEAQTAALEAELARATGDASEAVNGAERCVLVSVSSQPRAYQESALDELAELAATAGLKVVSRMIQRVGKVDYNNILGRAKLAELEVLALQGQAGLIVFDQELAPAQLNNLAEATERKVIDRTQLILDIFARRANSRSGKLQVELAQLQYRLPRLAGKSHALDRLAGGIGGKGPGETKLETDRRRLRERITRINNELKNLRRQRAFARSRRAKARLPVVSLVGYTNAGKSTLLNAMTGSDVLAEDKLFATLDPSSRRLRFPREKELILTDTVGFIRNLPKELIEAFRATLEELEEADLLLHVADASHPELQLHISAVEKILEDLHLNNIPRLLVLNKIDTLDDNDEFAPNEAPDEAPGESPAHPAIPLYLADHPEPFIMVSAKTGYGLPQLAAAILEKVEWKRADAVDHVEALDLLK